MEGGRGQVEVEGFGESDDSSDRKKCGCVRARAESLSEDRDCDGWIWGFGSGGEGTNRYVDHRRGGLSDGGEGQGTRHQPDFRWASRDGGVWGGENGSNISLKRSLQKRSGESKKDGLPSSRLLRDGWFRLSGPSKGLFIPRGKEKNYKGAGFLWAIRNRIGSVFSCNGCTLG